MCALLFLVHKHWTKSHFSFLCSPDDIVDGDVDEAVVERVNLHGAAGQRLCERDPSSMHEGSAVLSAALEPRVHLVLHDKHDVSCERGRNNLVNLCGIVIVVRQLLKE